MTFERKTNQELINDLTEILGQVYDKQPLRSPIRYISPAQSKFFNDCFKEVIPNYKNDGFVPVERREESILNGLSKGTYPNINKLNE